MPTIAPSDISLVFKELEGESDRAAITVGGSVLEYALELCIESRLREPQEQPEKEILFADKGIIGAFYEKIWMAYFLKIIGPQSRRDIDLIREIRNEAAHSTNPISFENTPAIANRCRELIFAKESIPGKGNPPDVRGMFVVTVQFYSANLMLRSGDSSAEIAEAFKQLAPYLDR
jgi:hypothetical protein